MLLWKVGGLIIHVKGQGVLGHLREEKSYKCFRIDGSEVCNFNFSRLHPKVQSIHIQMDSIVAKSLVKMGNTRNKSLTVLSKEIWDYLLSKEITVSAKYLPGLLNVKADTQSRTVRDASEWKLNPRIF